MTSHIDDTKARREALNIEASYIVQAPAGSGKTELLIQRYLKLLAHVQRPEQILAMTFTRKAAGEMKHRVLEALDRAQNPTPPQEAHEKTTWEIARQALNNSEKQGWRLLENPLRLKIQTIDSFCASLTKQTPLLSGMGSLLEVEENSRELYRETAHRVLARVEEDSKAGKAVRSILKRLDNSKSRFLDRIVQLLNKRDQWMISFSENADEYRSRADQERILSQLVESILKECHDSIPSPLKTELALLARYSGSTIATDNPDHPLACLENQEDFPLPKADQLHFWKALVSILLTNDTNPAPRKKATKSTGFPADKNGTARDMKDRMQEVLDKLRKDENLVNLLAVVKTLPHPCLSDEEWEFLESMFDLLPEINKTLRRVFTEQGKTDFSEIALSSINALGQEMAPSDLLLKLDSKLDHILVDEFQDTSFKQIALLKLLTEGWEAGAGNSLFLVGDPMQSIYRFRDAEVGLFVQAKKKGLGHIPLIKLQLLANFRSQKHVVHWVNQCFAEILPTVDDPDRGAIAYTECAAVQEASLQPGVKLYPVTDSKTDEEAYYLVEVIKDIRKQHPDDSIAILVRARTHLLNIVPQLQREGIQFRAEEIDPLTSRPAILDLLALMRALISPLDRVSWLSILRAPWCGLTLNDLHQLCYLDRKSPVWELLNQSERFGRLSADGRQRAARFIDILQPVIKLFPTVNFRNLLEGCWISLGGPACIDACTTKDIQVFFDKVSEVLDSGDFDTLHNFETILNHLFANPSTGEGHTVQIMTVHKAKGLEFDFVLLPGLGRTPKADENQLINWVTHGDNLLFAPIPEAGEEKSEIYKFLKQMDQERSRYESRRLMYVATTRTKKQLHLFGHIKTRKEGVGPERHSMLDHLWSFIGTEWTAAFESQQATQPPATEPPTQIHYLKRLPASFNTPAAPPTLETESAMDISLEEENKEKPFDWAGTEARCLGNVLHRCFETIAKQGIENWNEKKLDQLKPSLNTALLAEGMSPLHLEKTVQKGMRALKNILKDNDGRKILKRYEYDEAEYALTFVEGRNFKNKIVDRTYVDDEGIRWIIDYKTGEHEGSNLKKFFDDEIGRYRGQLESYEQLIRLQGETRTIKKALYYPLHQRLVEI
jgi:ATP-dependent exoDNAse (exonuclease V) beta subunit